MDGYYCNVSTAGSTDSAEASEGKVFSRGLSLDTALPAQHFQDRGHSRLYCCMKTKLWHSMLISLLMFLTCEKIQKAVGAVVVKMLNPATTVLKPAAR